jgi:hypothetical protein
VSTPSNLAVRRATGADAAAIGRLLHVVVTELRKARR